MSLTSDFTEALSGIFSYQAAQTKAENIKRISRYNAQVQLNSGIQQELNQKTNAANLETTRKSQVYAEGQNEFTARLQLNQAEQSNRASVLARGGDASTLESSQTSMAVQGERMFQRMGYQEGQLEANTDYQGKLATFAGSMAAREGRQASAMTIATGDAEASSVKAAANATAWTDFAKFGTDLAGDLMGVPSMPGGGKAPTSDPTSTANSFSWTTSSSSSKPFTWY